MIQADPINALVLNYVARLKTINAHLTVKAARAPTLLPYQSVELGARLQQNRAPYTHLQDRNHPEKLVRLPASGEQMFVDQPVVFEVGGHAALSTVATPVLPIEGIPLDSEEEKDELPGDEPEGTGEVASEEEEAETGEEEDSEGAESNEEPDEGEVKCKKEDCSDLFDLAPTPNNHLSGNGLPAASIPVTPLVTGEQLQHGHIVVPSEESYEQPDLVNLKPSRPPTIFNPNKFQPGPPEIVSHNDIYGTTNKYFSNWELTTRSSSASSLHIISSNLILLHLFIGLLVTSGLNNLLLNRRR